MCLGVWSEVKGGGFPFNQHKHTSPIQEVISCCCFHFAFSHQMFYSFPGMLVKSMKGETGIELIMFYGSKTQWGLRFFARVFFSQLTEWLTLAAGCLDPAAEGDRFEAWERHPGEFCSLGCQYCLPLLISHSLLNVFITICISLSHFSSTFYLLCRLPLRPLDYIKVAVAVFRVQASNILMSGCCWLINVSWYRFCLHAKNSCSIFPS